VLLLVGVDCFCWSSGERRIVVLVDCFMCMVVLVLRIAYGQVVCLRTVLNLWLDN
jgi:hypothetical protein